MTPSTQSQTAAWHVACFMLTLLNANSVTPRTADERYPIQTIAKENGPFPSRIGSAARRLQGCRLLLGTRPTRHRQGFGAGDVIPGGASGDSKNRTEVTAMNTRTSLYARVSTRERGQDTQNQLHQLREFAAKQGWVVVHEFVNHESGSTDNREQFQAMFQAASRREFDVLLFWSLDRFSRKGVFQT